MKTRTYKHWWFLTVNGIISILIGIMMLLVSKDLILEILHYFGIAMLVAGIILLIGSIYSLKRDIKAIVLVLQSIVYTTMGLFIILTPKADILNFFMLLSGVWAIIVGIFQLAILVNTDEIHANKNVILLNGLLTIAFGVCLCFRPFEFADLLARALGAFASLLGLIMIYLSLMLRKVTVIRSKEEEPHVL